MKKIILISMIAIAAFGVIGCGEDDGSKADLKWTNNDGDTLNTIQWVSGGKADQTWDGDCASGGSTTYKGIGELAGQGECFIGSSPATITLDSGSSTGFVTGTISSNSAVIEENAAATLVISNAAKK